MSRSPQMDVHQTRELDAASAAARLSRLPARGMALRILVAISAVYFFDLYDQSTFGIVAPAVRASQGFSLDEIAALVSLTFAGMLVGALVGGRIADNFGRLPILRCGLLLASLGSLGHVFVHEMTGFAILRLATSIGMGVIFIVGMSYLTEVSPVNRRGSRVALAFFVGGLGGASVAVMSRFVVPLGPETWRWMFAGGGLGLLALLLLARLPESPLWLLTKGRQAEAEKALQVLEAGVRRSIGDLPPVEESAPIAPATEAADDDEPAKQAGWREAVTGRWLRPTILLTAIWVLYSTVTQTFSVWLTTLLGQRGFSTETSLTIAAIAIIGAPIGMLLAAAVADRYPRRVQIFGVAVVAGITGLLFGILPAAGVVAAMAFIQFVLFSWFSPVLNSAMMDEYPTALRSTGAGVGYSAGRLWSIVFPFTVAAALTSFGAGIVGWVLMVAWFLIAILGLGLRGGSLDNR